MSTRPNVGGTLDMSAYAQLADLNRPTDPIALATEIRRLHASGLTARDIATALRLAPDVVINLLDASADLTAASVQE
jgi:hypothetical protein